MSHTLKVFLISSLILMGACKKESGKVQCSQDYIEEIDGEITKTQSSLTGERNYRYKITSFNSNKNPTISASTSDHFAMTKAKELWSYSKGAGVIVAVIDTGIDLNHADLKQKLWININEIPNNGKDDDSNGFVDDVNGVNLITGSSNVQDDHGHGTHVSGLIAGERTGVAPEAKIMVIKSMDHTGQGELADSARAVRYAVKNGAHIINASWGSTAYSTVLRREIEAAKSKGIIFVSAAGNDTKNNDTLGSFPATYSLPNVVATAAASQSNSLIFLSNFSNYGTITVPGLAPGFYVESAYLGGSLRRMSGTSMASPIMAGLMALAKGISPNSSYQDIISGTLCTNYNLNLSTSFKCLGTVDNIKKTFIDRTKPLLSPVYQRVDEFETISLNSNKGMITVLEGDGRYNEQSKTLALGRGITKVSLKDGTQETIGFFSAGNSEPHEEVECE